ncbi:MAG: bifunctional response regulator/alkaline phosphatase family protein [Bacteroidales bacterium]|nr:bifunctional response regulator/alkaline phosphatase family protein [Bacteroidales bacterium]
MGRQIHILWTDDEIDLLKPYILFLEERDYRVTTAANGNDALNLVELNDFDLIFLDENMPGLSGLETLERIKILTPSTPVVMITKSEEEDIMDEALGGKISDYLIKPVNPKQILLSIKKNIDTKRLVTQKTTSGYQSQFGRIGMQINSASTFGDWTDIYTRLVYWEREFDASGAGGMEEVLQMQKSEANKEFSRFIRKHYEGWFSGDQDDKPLLSPGVFRKKVFPLLQQGKVMVVLIDNLRYDQWKIIEQEMNDLYRTDEELIFSSILPTATQYARNAMFAGMMPGEIQRQHPGLWVDENEEGSKNAYEEELCRKQMQRLGLGASFNYEKISNQRAGKKLVENYSDLLNYDLNIVVYNFVDMLSHARTEIEMIRELAYDESSYRSLVQSWFQHSYLFDLLKEMNQHDITLVITTDHGAVRVSNPVKVIGDRQTSVNLRYKQGKNLNYPPKEVFDVVQPELVQLPRNHMTTSYIFAMNNDYLVYPNNYNHFVNLYRNTFQHGGISMEEMLIPLSILSPVR